MHAVPVLRVADPAAVRRPAGVALVEVRRRDRPGLAAASRDYPEVQPAAALGAKEHGLPVGRDLGRGEGPPGPVVEEPRVANDGPRVGAVGVDFDHVVVDPAVVHAHVEEPLAVGGPTGIAFVQRVAGQTVHFATRHRHLPDVHVAEAIARKRDPGAVGRPGEAVRARGEPGELDVDAHLDASLGRGFAGVGRPQPDLRRPALVRCIGDPPSVGRPDRLRGAERSDAAQLEVFGEGRQGAIPRVDPGEVPSEDEADRRAVG